jgi:aminopeptidase N
MAGNLTRAEAAARSRLLAVHSYLVRLDVSGDDTEHFASTSTVTFSCAEPAAVTFIDIAAEVTQVTLNGHLVDARPDTAGRLTLRPLAGRNELTVAARGRYSVAGEGLHRFTDPEDGETYLYTHFQPADAHRVYACFDQPDLKAPFELTVTAPSGWQVISNNEPDLASTTGRWHFPPTPPLPPYLTMMAAGPYHVERDRSGVVPLGVYCRKALAASLDAAEIFATVGQGITFYEKNFGRLYPFAKCDYVFVPEHNYGAMENAAAITFTEEFIFRSRVTDGAREERAEILLHELAHMWFGDLVTMRWWDDLWLNESFATFASILCQAEATRFTSAWTTFTQAWKGIAYRQDQLPTTHPVAADIPDLDAVAVNFDGITYAKGAAVLRQLVAYVGRENFLAGVRRYFAAHEWGNADLTDLLAALEAASGRDLRAWSAQWLRTAGVDILRPEFTVGPDGRLTSFAVVQEAAEHGDQQLRTHRLAIGFFCQTNEVLVRVSRFEAEVAGARTEFPALTGLPCPDMVLLNDDDLAYAKLRLDASSLRCLTGGAGVRFAEPLPAALCWAAAWEMCRDGELAARDYVELVLSGIDSTADTSVTESLMHQAALAIRRYDDPADSPAGLAALAAGLRSLMLAAPPGSDRQLGYARAFADVAVTPDQLALLCGLLDGSVTVSGLVVDTALRWTLLYRLVSRGVFGPADIEAGLAADASESGQRQAARCRAAVPSEDAKRDAWTLISTAAATGMAAATMKAILAGFNDPDQSALTEGYAERYFALAGHLWDQEGGQLATAFVKAAYPASITGRIVALTDAYLSECRPPGLRRLLIEAREDTRRALAARSRNDRRPGRRPHA